MLDTGYSMLDAGYSKESLSSILAKLLWRSRPNLFFFEHNAACPVVAIAKTEDWAKRPFMDGH
jgi:hypothetical protein